MDPNNNNPNVPNANGNRFAGRAVPLGQRVNPQIECRKCHQRVANLNRHEALCQGNAKPYRCPLCMIGYNSQDRARRHFLLRHVGEPVPQFFLNPFFRRGQVHQQAAAAPQPPAAPAGVAPQPPAAAAADAPQPPPQNQIQPQPEAVPMQVDQPQVVNPFFVAVEEPVAGPAPPPAPIPPAAAAAAVVGGDGVLPAPPVAQPAAVGGGFGAGGVAGPAQIPVAPPQGGNVCALGERQLDVLLRYNLAANVRQAREALGDDLAVVHLVLQMLRDPAQFLPG